MSEYQSTAPKRSMGLGSWQLLVSVFSSTDQHQNIILCVVSLKTPYLYRLLIHKHQSMAL